MLLTTDIRNLLAQRGGADHFWLAFFNAKTRDVPPVDVSEGLWTGDYDRSFTVDGVSRSYYGAGGLIAVRGLTFDEGLIVQVTRLTLGIATPEVGQFIRAHEPRGATLDLHLAVFEPGTETLVGITRAFRGFVDKVSIRRTGKSDVMHETCEIEGVSAARRGTYTLAGKKSDATQRLRDNADRGRRYGNVTATPNWGDTTDEDSFRIGGGSRGL